MKTDKLTANGIDPKSLRIGNYLQGDPLNIPKWGISSDGIVQITAHGIYLLDEMHREGKELPYKPIPLSEQELIRLGFEYEKSTVGGFERWEITDECGRNIKILDKKFTWGVGKYTKHILYVHQLQNLFYALKGEELTYKVESGLTPTEPDTLTLGEVFRNIPKGKLDSHYKGDKKPVIGSNGIINGKYQEDPGE